MFHASDRVLVAIMNNRRDLEIARQEGWYRIPRKAAPSATTEVAVLAFYLTKVFDDDKWCVRYYAPVRGHELARRRDLLPDQPDHARADEVYYKLQLGPLMELEHAIPSLRWRRITFIETSWDRFSAAQEINDLYASGADGLFVTLRDAGFYPEREYLHASGDTSCVVDLAIPCQEGTVAICVGDEPAPPGVLCNPDVGAVRQEIERLGGAQPVHRDGG
jgi:hypothetical protein